MEKSILVRNDSLASVLNSFEPKEGDKYIAFELLYPLLMQSSDQAANLISDFVGRRSFVGSMNKKSDSLEMISTTYSDPSGSGDDNLTSADDVLKLLKYLSDF